MALPGTVTEKQQLFDGKTPQISYTCPPPPHSIEGDEVWKFGMRSARRTRMMWLSALKTFRRYV